MQKQGISHPDMLEDPSVTERNRLHSHRGRNLERKRSPLRDIPYLSGNVLDRKAQLKRRKKPEVPRGDAHYMRKKAKVRAWEQRAYRTTPRGAKHLYTYWRNVRSPTDVSFEEWFVLRNSAFPEVRGERITICRYDNTKPWFLENLYVARTRGSKELEMLFDAQTLIGTRKAVCVYAAPAGKMDARRN